MKVSPLRVIRAARHVTGQGDSAGLETQETALRSLPSRRPTAPLTRTALSLLLTSALMGAFACTGHAQDAAKPADTAPKPGDLTITGLVDVYLGINFRAPSSAANKPPTTAVTPVVTPSGEIISIDNVGRSFDINDRDPSFSLGEINLTRTQGKGIPVGITATLTFGDTARIVHSTEPGGTSSWQTLQQLYVTRTVNALKRDITVDFGKFVTPFGYEVIESSSNDNYSRSFGFQFGIPFYHAGLRLTVPVNKSISLVTGVVNGWNNVADDNNAKSVFGQLTWKPDSRFTGIVGYMGGAEGTGAFGAGIPMNAGNITINLGEFQPILQLNSKLKLAGDIIYARAAGDVNAIKGSGSWLGMAAYARYQLKSNYAAAVRVEQFEDIPGPGPGMGGLRLGGGYQKLREATLTLEYTMAGGRLVSRLEYRHDHSRTPFFAAANGRITSDQDTLYFGQVYKF